MSEDDYPLDDDYDELREPTRSDKRRKGIEYRKALEGVFDKKTLEALANLKKFKVLEDIYYVVSTGKEADVFYGKTTDGRDVAVKIYRIHTSRFKRIDDYILGDRRFGKIRSNIKLKWSWARREFKNLKLAFRAGVSVPEPITVHRNIVVMEFIGEEGVPAPLLRDADLEEIGDIDKFFKAIIDDIDKLYKKAKLVHADLSPFNILLWKGKHYIIDLAQGVKIDQEYALRFLYRDLVNLTAFFQAYIEEEINPDELFKQITGRYVDPFYKSF
ncbi:MAG: serine protein kinase RIO [Candidatus Njordarchaeia archaeon]